MRRALSFTLGAMALTGCVPVGPDAAGPPGFVRAEGYAASEGADGALSVTRTAQPFTYSDGAEAKRAANAICGGAVASGPEDNYRDGAWIFVRGCA